MTLEACTREFAAGRECWRCAPGTSVSPEKMLNSFLAPAKRFRVPQRMGQRRCDSMALG